MHSDAELLRLYLDEQSQEAFTALVQRHLPFVYGIALRRVGGATHLAEDVCQTVFVDFARKAASLRRRATLVGWLVVATHRASAAVVRTERRRRARELQAMQTPEESSGPDEARRLRPLLDDIIVQLAEDEREAIALRFFEQRSFADIGAALRLTEEAARKRVERALTKMRRLLRHRGVTATTAAIAGVLVVQQLAAPPSSLATRIAVAALARASTLTTGTTAVVTTLSLATAVLTGTAFVGYQWNWNRQLRAELSRLETEVASTAALRSENRRLARTLEDFEALRRAQAELPAAFASTPTPQLPATPPPAARATVTVQADGTLLWDRERVTLTAFLQRLGSLRTGAPDNGSKVSVRGFSTFAPLAYVIGETRKAHIDHVVVESAATLDPSVAVPWFDLR
jgi:RNA polymerase sigma factor (sigma-70 family)